MIRHYLAARDAVMPYLPEVKNDVLVCLLADVKHVKLAWFAASYWIAKGKETNRVSGMASYLRTWYA